VTDATLLIGFLSSIAGGYFVQPTAKKVLAWRPGQCRVTQVRAVLNPPDPSNLVSSGVMSPSEFRVLMDHDRAVSAQQVVQQQLFGSDPPDLDFAPLNQALRSLNELNRFLDHEFG
jgi:hypothetical protein